MEKSEKPLIIGGPRPGAGRPEGTMTTETNDILIRLRSARGLTQLELALELDIPFSTYRRYETKRLLPKAGPVRTAIIKAAKRAGIDIEEPKD